VRARACAGARGQACSHTHTHFHSQTLECTRCSEYFKNVELETTREERFPETEGGSDER
jgi:hypothetical protein